MFYLMTLIVNSSDVLQDMRVNVSEEGSEKVIWYKVNKQPLIEFRC